jgi:hypothetical protein
MRRRTFLTLAPAAVCAAGAGGIFSQGRGRGWLVLDFDAVFCGDCFAPVLDFLRAVPAAAQERALTAVLVFASPRPPADPAGRRRIVEAKWDGLRRANGWTASAVFDSGPDFRLWLGRKTARLALFDGPARSVRVLDLPLPAGGIDAAVALLLD